MIKVIFLAVLTWTNHSAASDSLRTETINGKVFIIHRVDEHETLYGISRRYSVPIASILEFNPGSDAGLEVGQLLKIPYVPRTKVQVAVDGALHKVAPKETLFSISRLYNVSVDDLKAWNNLKDNSLSTGQELIVRKNSRVPRVETKTEITKPVQGQHTVAASETLFSIARKYGVSVQQLRKWNTLSGDDVKVGNLLWVTDPPGDGRVAEVTPPVQEETRPVVKEEIKAPVTEEVKMPVQENTIIISENVRGSDEVKEGGLAELIEGTDGNRKYLALHRKAKVGTILKVRNELNNREVFVRVVGPLPDTGVNDKIVVKISKSAFERLGAIDPKFRAEVTYYK